MAGDAPAVSGSVADEQDTVGTAPARAHSRLIPRVRDGSTVRERLRVPEAGRCAEADEVLQHEKPTRPRWRQADDHVRSC
ncbi:hypothetical protein GCM10025866_14290 [Naasia aerilata]|uniref:Uncharacterized protein n=1 Tax=Naasia aerilata TaxID=1162966 RepID=A0ABN6XKP1_9MICO|nr:hypothetical protein GCM10025866_14290 [Naasia aerilata]